MKVSEAKTKVCPFVNHAFAFNPGYYTQIIDDYSHANINCICGDCMAWQYTDTHHDSGGEKEEESKSGYCKRLEQ